uniref:EF-hand domain-containing protein n=1 Tax=Strigamia maritima TaxID=126957 RepID=T1J6U6_STRMM
MCTHVVILLIIIISLFIQVQPECCPYSVPCLDCTFLPADRLCCSSNDDCNFACCGNNCKCKYRERALNCQFDCAYLGEPSSRRLVKRSNAFNKITADTGDGVVAQFDTITNDGRIDMDEMFNWFLDGRNLSTDRIRQMFTDVDTNNDNFVTADEIDPPRSQSRLRKRRKRTSGQNSQRKTTPKPQNNMTLVKPLPQLRYSTRKLNAEESKLFTEQSDRWFKDIAHQMRPDTIADVTSEPEQISVTLLTKGLRNICAIQVTVKPERKEEMRFELPSEEEMVEFTCNDNTKFKSRMIKQESRTMLRVPMAITGPLTAFGFLAQGYEELLLAQVCFSFGAKAANSDRAKVVCLDTTFFAMCTTLGYSGFNWVTSGSNMKFRKEYGRVQGFILDKFPEFIKAFDESLTKGGNVKRMADMCWRIVWRQSPTSACPGDSRGCPRAVSSSNDRIVGLVDINSQRCKP